MQFSISRLIIFTSTVVFLCLFVQQQSLIGAGIDVVEPHPKEDPPESSDKMYISYSLYGSSPRYTDGALENVRLAREMFPGWTVIMYIGQGVPDNVWESLRNSSNVAIKDMRNTTIRNGMMWRFLVASEPSAARYIIRDVDARLILREKQAVDEWVFSGRLFHVIRDHISHINYFMGGGLWGAVREAIPNMKELIEEHNAVYRFWGDMDFLRGHIWPRAKQSILQHDSFSCVKWGALPFPFSRISGHVGAIFRNKKAITFAGRSPEPCRSPDRTAMSRGALRGALIFHTRNASIFDVDDVTARMREWQSALPDWTIVFVYEASKIRGFFVYEKQLLKLSGNLSSEHPGRSISDDGSPLLDQVLARSGEFSRVVLLEDFALGHDVPYRLGQWLLLGPPETRITTSTSVIWCSVVDTPAGHAAI